LYNKSTANPQQIEQVEFELYSSAIGYYGDVPGEGRVTLRSRTGGAVAAPEIFGFCASRATA
jgi:hypothetical protein